MAAPLIYLPIVSADGYIAGPDGSFGWAEPDSEVMAFVTELASRARTELHGRRMHEVMSVWDDLDRASLSPAELAFAEWWDSVDKIVYSTTLTEVSTRRTQLRNRFDPAEVAKVKADAAHPITVGGGRLATAVARAGLLDEVHLIVAPAVVGGGTPFIGSEVRFDLELRDIHRFGSGLVHLGYAVR